MHLPKLRHVICRGTKAYRSVSASGLIFAARFFICLSLAATLRADTPAAATPPAKLNVLFIMSDDLRCELSCYGAAVCRTQNLDRLAARGVVFERAYCQFPVCGPSRASIMSGLYPQTTRLVGNQEANKLGSFHRENPALKDHPSIAELFRRNGYTTARVSKIFHMGVPGDIESGSPGGDDPRSWNTAFNIKAPETRSPGAAELLSPKQSFQGAAFKRIIVPDDAIATQADMQAAAQALTLLHTFAKDQKPFFLAVGFVRPHVPQVAPASLFEQYPSKNVKLPDYPRDDLDDVPVPERAMNNATRYGMNEEQQQKATAAYWAAVTFMDQQVGKLLDALDELKLADNTLVVFMADHGYSLGEHHCWQKSNLFEEATRAPLIIADPRSRSSAGQRTARIVEYIDVYPTLADLCGLHDQVPPRVEGTSLRPLIADPAGKIWTKTAAYTLLHEGRSVRTNRWRYTDWGAAGLELYDHETDPQEVHNLARDPKYADVLQEHRALMEKFPLPRASSSGSGKRRNSEPDDDTQ